MSDEPNYIAVFSEDAARMSPDVLAMTTVSNGQRAMRFENGRCSALVSRNGRHTCHIYPMRPDACRWLQRDSGTCRTMIADHRA